MKDTILRAAVEVLALHGLNNWTIEEVANRAHCAKGLVNYHFRSKQELLTQAAETIRYDRIARRTAAARTPGSAALDRLWATLVGEVDSGWFGAWVSLLAADDRYRSAGAETDGDALRYIANLSRSLGLDGELEPATPLIRAVLDGVELRLLQGARRTELENAYHRFWAVLIT